MDASGCSVEIIGKSVSVYDANGKLLRHESIVDYTKSNIVGKYASLDNFIQQWSAEDKKRVITELLREQGIDLEAMKAEQNMSDVDDFDFICHVTFDKKPLSEKSVPTTSKSATFSADTAAWRVKYSKRCSTDIWTPAFTKSNKPKSYSLTPSASTASRPKSLPILAAEMARQALKELEAELYKAG